VNWRESFLLEPFFDKDDPVWMKVCYAVGTGCLLAIIVIPIIGVIVTAL
jgi:hypothetical protein